MKHLTDDMKKLFRNRRLFACYLLIGCLQLGLGAAAIHQARSTDGIAERMERVHVVNDMRLVQHEILVKMHAEL